ncbi:type IV pilin protein [uncultured Thiodictyon sp.]|uniref:type IV pilin protein n=1 Tax=uncultured Thiodictyon sp. TaxID=1846217 RepID=UPI0025F780A9|nr:type IV pilin protein [uncultured Thiodictyon sp.]
MHCNKSAGRHSPGAGLVGFTLVELMVTLVIVAILAAVAYPSYVAQVRRGSRAEVKGALLEDAQFLERNYTVNNCYHRTDANCTTACTPPGSGCVSLPREQSPERGAAKYTITVAYSDEAPCTLGHCFTLSAVPTGTMTGDACGTLTLDQAGIQGASGDVATCWQR